MNLTDKKLFTSNLENIQDSKLYPLKNDYNMIIAKYGVKIKVMIGFPDQLVTWLDEGSYGTVYRIGKKHVIKFQIVNASLPRRNGSHRYTDDSSGYSDFVAKKEFESEVKTFQLFSSWGVAPHFVSNGFIDGIFTDNNEKCQVGYIISEYIDRKQGGIDLKESFKQLRPVMEIFWNDHGKYVADLHEANIIVSKTGKTFICDFGCIGSNKVFKDFSTFFKCH